MKFTGEFIYLGVQTRTSKKSGNEYNLVKILEPKSDEIYEMYVPSDRLKLITNVAAAKKLSKCCCHFEVSGFNGKMNIDLVGFEV